MNPRAIAIADAARRLVELRDRWLNPPEWVEWVDEPVAGYPKRPVPTVIGSTAKNLGGGRLRICITSGRSGWWMRTSP